MFDKMLHFTICVTWWNHLNHLSCSPVKWNNNPISRCLQEERFFQLLCAHVILHFVGIILGTSQFSSMTHICLMVPQGSQVLLAMPGSAESMSPCLQRIWFDFDSGGAVCAQTLFSIKEAKAHAHSKAQIHLQVGGSALSRGWSDESGTVPWERAGTCSQRGSAAGGSPRAVRRRSAARRQTLPQRKISDVFRERLLSGQRSRVCKLFVVPRISLAVWWSLWIP